MQQLTPSQRSAVAYDQHLIIFAGPGSGKTATSVAKGISILKDPKAVLGMVTFTTAAAGEMRERMKRSARAQQMQLQADRLICGTFHSIALRHYQRHARKPLQLLPPPSRSAIINTMLQGLSPDERGEYGLALERFQGALEPGEVEVLPEHRKFIQEYLDKLRTSHSADLATIMRECTVRMRDGEFPLLPITHLLGDEMQDADQIQLEFMLLHSRAGVTTTLVADDDQCIYEWRSALGYEGLIRFEKEAGARTITLGENFRSYKQIVSHAQLLIARNDPHRIQKRQEAVRGDGGTLAVQPCADLRSECKVIAEAIAGAGDARGSIAVLARANRSLDDVEEALSAAAIPYVRESSSIWAAPEVATYLAWLNALLSSATGNLLPVIGLLELDRGLLKDLEKALGRDCSRFLDGEVPDLGAITNIDHERLEKFAIACQRWRRDLKAGAVNMVIASVKSHLKQIYKDHFRDEKKDDDSRRTQRVDGLLSAAERVLLRIPGVLSARLAQIASMQKAAAADPTAVRLLTMHSSKGLEFDTVFVVDACHPDDGSTLMQDQPERRLFYVAITRARDQFFATYHGKPVKYLDEAEVPASGSIKDEMLSSLTLAGPG